MKKMTDKQIQQSVFAALEPQIGSTEIGVAVQDGVVTLCGTIDTHRQRDFAGQAARQVYGVRAVVNDLRVVPTVIGTLSDMQIALEAVWALEAQNTVVPTKRLQMTVRDGWITVEGEVDTPDQREVAEAVLLCQPGVRGITDLIAVQPQVIPVEVQYEIEEALLLCAERYAGRMRVDTAGLKVIRKGGVRPGTGPALRAPASAGGCEREDAERAARRAPGVTDVENRILVVPG